MFEIITITCGRTLYLNRLLKSISSQSNHFIKKHKIIFQDNSFEEKVFENVNDEYKSKINIIKTQTKKTVGSILNEIKTEETDCPYVMKLDDDAIIRSQDFFENASEITKLIPGSVFSPFPVGLINNLGGIQSNNRKVLYSENLNIFYTFRKVNHVGGFARISPSFYFKSINFSDSHNEDVEFSNFCHYNNIEMFYLENSLIIEHQESTLGQHQRYGEKYFKGRF
jgi:hypothetical protein